MLSRHHNTETLGSLEVSHNTGRKQKNPKCTQHETLKVPQVNMFTADHYPRVSEG